MATMDGGVRFGGNRAGMMVVLVVLDALCVKSSSSYYSLSSSGDLESDKEAQDEHVAMLEEASGGYKKELWGGDSTYERQTMEDVSK